LFTGVVAPDDKFIAGDNDTSDKFVHRCRCRWRLFFTSVVDTVEKFIAVINRHRRSLKIRDKDFKFIAGVVDTSEQLIAGVIDTGDKHSFANISIFLQGMKQ
jgi:hypothetical protein